MSDLKPFKMPDNPPTEIQKAMNKALEAAKHALWRHQNNVYSYGLEVAGESESEQELMGLLLMKNYELNEKNKKLQQLVDDLWLHAHSTTNEGGIVDGLGIDIDSRLGNSEILQRLCEAISSK